MKQLLISLLLLAGLSACSGEKGKEPDGPVTVESTTLHSDSHSEEHEHAEADAALSRDMQRHVHEIDSLLEGI